MEKNVEVKIYKSKRRNKKKKIVELESDIGMDAIDKSKDKVLAEREAKRLAKKMAKAKSHDKDRNLDAKDSGTSQEQPTSTTMKQSKPITSKENTEKHKEQQPTAESNAVVIPPAAKEEKSRESILAERELKKKQKAMAKNMKSNAIDTTAAAGDKTIVTEKIESKISNLSINSGAQQDAKPIIIPPKQVLSKAERRAKQEAQRAAKQNPSKPASNTTTTTATIKAAKSSITETAAKEKQPDVVSSPINKKTLVKQTLHRVKLFNHLYCDQKGPENILNSTTLHPAIIKLGAQYANSIVVGSNARCIAFMNTIKMVIQEYETPSQKEFSRGLESTIQLCVNYLHQCRPLSVSITNAAKFIKWQITQLPTTETDAVLKDRLIDSIETYIRDQIEKAAQAISISVQEKISNSDVILTFGCSSLINHILVEAKKRKVDFRVIIVDGRPDLEGQEMLRRLVSEGIRCTYVLINAIGFIMPEVTKVLLGAHALMANGYVMSRAGTAQVALVAKTYNVPVLVCCETHKFSERVQTDAFVYNEIGDPTDLVLKGKGKQSNPLSAWENLPHLTPLNLRYDITPPELVTAVVTELAILPCTSVPVILRIKPSEIGY